MAYSIWTDAVPEDFGPEAKHEVRKVTIRRDETSLYEISMSPRDYIDPFQMIGAVVGDMYVVAREPSIK